MEKKWEYNKPYIELVLLAEVDLIRTSLNIGDIGTDPTDPWDAGAQ